MKKEIICYLVDDIDNPIVFDNLKDSIEYLIRNKFSAHCCFKNSPIKICYNDNSQCSVDLSDFVEKVVLSNEELKEIENSIKEIRSYKWKDNIQNG